MNHLRQTTSVKATIVITFMSVLFHYVSATNHSVGGTSGWDLGSDLQNWSSSASFHTGDNLVFTYGPTHDVLEVDRIGYNLCQISNPIRTYNHGNTNIHLEDLGTRYFICGTKGHCASGLKLQVDILPPSPSEDPGRRHTPRSPPHSLPMTPPPPKPATDSPPSVPNTPLGPAPEIAPPLPIPIPSSGSHYCTTYLPILVFLLFL